MSKNYPFVSICTPTFNRRPFIEMMFSCFNNQTYPKDKMEWIIVDDGTDKIEDLIKNANIVQIKYFPIKKKMKLGEKRNFMHTKTKGEFLIYMDDDDYYPPERVEHAVDTLQKNPSALCAGSSELYIYFKHINQMYQSGPFGPTHSTAGTFAFRRSLLNYTQYDDNAAIAEERSFLKEYTIPLVQLDPMKTILVFSHNHNSFDKKNMLAMGENKCFKKSNKKVRDFIKQTHEEDIYQFFMKNIDKLLEKYKMGNPKHKPDVLKQMDEIQQERKQIDLANQQGASILVDIPGEGKRKLSPHEVITILTQQQNQIKFLVKRVKELEENVLQTQLQLAAVKNN